VQEGNILRSNVVGNRRLHHEQVVAPSDLQFLVPPRFPRLTQAIFGRLVISQFDAIHVSDRVGGFEPRIYRGAPPHTGAFESQDLLT
jgi:hypothetical protein